MTQADRKNILLGKFENAKTDLIKNVKEGDTFATTSKHDNAMEILDLLRELELISEVEYLSYKIELFTSFDTTRNALYIKSLNNRDVATEVRNKLNQ